MKISDIRSKDVVKFKADLTNEDKTRMVKFATRISGQVEMKEYVFQLLKNNPDVLKVDHCEQTQKVPTEYASIVTPHDVFVPIQTRYLELVSRKSRHPLTGIFQ